MNEAPMLFPITLSEFWKQIRTTIETVVTEKLSQENLSKTSSLLPEKALLKALDVCKTFQVSTPTLYEWLKQKKIKSFKVKSRRYFNRADRDALISASM
ncbi:MAG TPA: helix-turn-helix domain-containing protein [Chitinophagaceae bacterium]|nr:helix-turn-helix domain-containing protein [Chitinophagaceae bacterium]